MERAENNHKQTIVIRKDLNMRKGKMVAQGAHASMGAILGLARRESGLSRGAAIVVGLMALSFFLTATTVWVLAEVWHYWKAFVVMAATLGVAAYVARPSYPQLVIPLDPRVEPWLTGRFKKICVSVDGEQELLDLYERARAAGLVCSLIQDAGLTEFKVPTYTAVAIGPDREDVVDRFTKEPGKELPLL